MKTTGSATCFNVSDVDASIAWYMEVLGFSERFRFSNYAGIGHGGVQIHLAGPGTPNARAVGQGSIYIFVDDVDAYHVDITARGATAQAPPKDYEYGMRDFGITDPDGNILGFGQEVMTQDP